MNTKAAPGFTIVELLIVIVVIGILATIAVVSYDGAVSNSKTNSAKVSANVVAKRLDNYYSGTGTYPVPSDNTAATLTTMLATRADSTLTNTNVAVVGSLSPSNGQSSVAVSICTSPSGTAYSISYWDYTKNQVALTPVTGSVSTTACSTWQALN